MQGFNRIFAATIFFGTEDQPNRSRLIDRARFHIFDRMCLWFNNQELDQSVNDKAYENVIALSQTFYQEIRLAPNPGRTRGDCRTRARAGHARFLHVGGLEELECVRRRLRAFVRRFRPHRSTRQHRILSSPALPADSHRLDQEGQKPCGRNVPPRRDAWPACHAQRLPILGALAITGRYAYRRGKKLAIVSRRRELELDRRPPVLYLRSFKDDKVTSRSTGIGMLNLLLPQDTEEEQLAEALGEIGPFIATVGGLLEQLVPYRECPCGSGPRVAPAWVGTCGHTRSVRRASGFVQQPMYQSKRLRTTGRPRLEMGQSAPR